MVFTVAAARDSLEESDLEQAVLSEERLTRSKTLMSRTCTDGPPWIRLRRTGQSRPARVFDRDVIEAMLLDAERFMRDRTITKPLATLRS